MKKLVDTLPMQWKNSSTVNQLPKVHEKIIQSANEKINGFDLRSFKVAVGKIITAHGMTNIPDQLLAEMLFSCYQEKYSDKINPKEFELAFFLHVQGDLPKKFNHFQMFSVEWMCDVLNCYLGKKGEVVTENWRISPPEETPALPVADLNSLILSQLQKDFENKESEDIFSSGFDVKTKLEAVNEIWGIDMKTEVVIQFRMEAFKRILKRLKEERHVAKVNSKFGIETDLNFKIARLESGHGLTEKDEAVIQTEVMKLIYGNFLKNVSVADFNEGINLNK